MYRTHNRNTVRYFLLIVVFLTFLFFSNDFGLIDVQKTAIIIAAGIDRDGEDFIVTSQVAIPEPSDQGNAANAVQIVSRGKTVAEAFEEINAKTGWYPKLVFCNLILLGEETVKNNVFDALDYFLLDEYLSDNCLVAACDGTAKDVLNADALVDSSSSAAIQKVLSHHAEQVGTVYTSTLRTFAMGYFADNACGLLPIVKLQNQQEPDGESTPNQTPQENSSPPKEEKQGNEKSGGQQEKGQQGNEQSSQNQSGNGGKKGGEAQKPVFSAGETALFKHGKKVGTLTAEETFACNAVLNELRLAPYSVATQDATCTLSFKQNAPKIKLHVAKNGMANLKIQLTVVAGLLDYSKSLPADKLSDAGDVPAGVFSAAQKKLTGEIISLFEKTRALDCDVFSLRDRLRKTGNRAYSAYESTLLSNTVLEVDVQFKGVR